MCLRRAPEKYIAGAALDRAELGNMLGEFRFKLLSLKNRKFQEEVPATSLVILFTYIPYSMCECFLYYLSMLNYNIRNETA
jgi:hypothetical protein